MRNQCCVLWRKNLQNRRKYPSDSFQEVWSHVTCIDRHIVQDLKVKTILVWCDLYYWPCSCTADYRNWSPRCPLGYKGKVDNWGNRSNQKRNLCTTVPRNHACTHSPLGSVGKKTDSIRTDVRCLRHICMHVHTAHTYTCTQIIHTHSQITDF